MKKIMLLVLSLPLLLSSNAGCGGDDDTQEGPAPPSYDRSAGTRELESVLRPRVTALAERPYEDWLARFDPGTSSLMSQALEKYQGLFDTDYSTTDYKDIEQDYLQSVLGEYKGAREEALDPLKERYIAEGLYESGPGFQAEREFGEETAEGVGDITKAWAYEGIQRREEHRRYQDALKRGDYQTMYNLALSEESRKLAPAERATQAEFAGLEPAMGLFGQLSQEDIQRYYGATNVYRSKLGYMGSQQGQDSPWSFTANAKEGLGVGYNP